MIENNGMKADVTKDNDIIKVLIWSLDDALSLEQTFHPSTGQPWTSTEEAWEWAQRKIDFLE